MKEPCEITIIVPLFNEEAGFNNLIERLESVISKCAFSTDVLLIDDGSTDTTRELISNLAQVNNTYVGIFLSKNYGHQLAITAGMKYAKSKIGVFIIDSDLQDPPELILPWFELLTKERYDVIYGEREMLDEEGIFKKSTSNLFYHVLNLFTKERIPLNSGDFCMLSRRVVNILNAMPEKYRFIRGLRSSLGFKQHAYKYQRAIRTAGETKYTFRKMLALALDGIYGFSEVPYKLMMNTGVLLISLSTIYLLYSLIKSILGGVVVSGFLGLLAIIILMGGINLFGLGILGGYIIRNFFELKSRPLFLVDEIIEDQKSEFPQYE